MLHLGLRSYAGVGILFGSHVGVLGGLVGPNLVGGGREENLGIDHIVCVGNLQQTYTQNTVLQSPFLRRVSMSVEVVKDEATHSVVTRQT